MENVAVTCPARSRYSTPQTRFLFIAAALRPPPHGDALALSLTFGSAKTWRGDFHSSSFVPRPAHMRLFTRVRRVACKALLCAFIAEALSSLP